MYHRRHVYLHGIKPPTMANLRLQPFWVDLNAVYHSKLIEHHIAKIHKPHKALRDVDIGCAQMIFLVHLDPKLVHNRPSVQYHF